MSRANLKTLITLVVIAGAGVCNPVHATDRGVEERAIRATDAQWSADLQARDLDAVMENYAEEAVFLVPNQPIIVGKKAIRDWFKDRLATPGYRAIFTPTQIVVSASLDMAYELGTYEASVTGPDGRPVERVGKHLLAWEKRDGAWRVMAESISSDSPPGSSR